MTLTNSGAFWTTNQFLTGGFDELAIYWDGATLVTNTGPLWELQPVEVRARPVPPLVVTPSPRSNNRFRLRKAWTCRPFRPTSRNAAWRWSSAATSPRATPPTNSSRIISPFPAASATHRHNSGKIYNITHLQFLQADYLRGYTFGTTNLQPGRRILATPMHAHDRFQLRQQPAPTRPSAARNS